MHPPDLPERGLDAVRLADVSRHPGGQGTQRRLDLSEPARFPGQQVHVRPFVGDPGGDRAAGAAGRAGDRGHLAGESAGRAAAPGHCASCQPAITGLASRPRPSNSTTTSSPTAMTCASEVPVAMTSPGCKVMSLLRNSRICGSVQTRSLVDPVVLVVPFTETVNARPAGSSSSVVAIDGPIGQN